MALQQHGRRAVVGERLDDDAPDLLVADQGERGDGDLAAELVGHRGEHARDRLAARRPRRGVAAVGVRDAAHVVELAVEVAVGGGVRGGGEIALDQAAVQVADHDRLGRELGVGHAAGLDDHELLAGDARGEVAARPGHQAVARELGVQRADLAAQLGELVSHGPPRAGGCGAARA